MEVRELNQLEEAPMHLLLLADPSPSLIEDYLHKGHCYLGVEANDIIGVYILLAKSSTTIELVNLAVAPQFQNQGIGKQLINHAIQIAKNKGYQTIEVGTGNSSIGQLALYQKCGFSIYAVDRDFFVKHYDEPIFENGIHCRDMIRLKQTLG